VTAPPHQRHLAALVRTLRDNTRLLAVLARRCEVHGLAPPSAGPTFRQPADIVAYLGPEMADLPQEQLRVVLLDRRGRLLDAPLVSQGGQTETAVRLADCFREAVRRSAAAVVLVHSHPSGDPAPSPEDVRLTQDAAHAGALLGIPVLDHVIIAHEGFVSLRAEGLFVPPRAAHDADPSSDNSPAPAQLLRRWGDGAFPTGWGYDCERCGAHVRGLEASRLGCQRCLARVSCRVIDATREADASESVQPAAA
jgi:proteasome lid subunit RPN8/RPN11